MQTQIQQTIIITLGVALFLLILMRYDTEIIIAIVSGLIGFLTNKTITENTQKQTPPEETIEKNIENTGEDNAI